MGKRGTWRLFILLSLSLGLLCLAAQSARATSCDDTSDCPEGQTCEYGTCTGETCECSLCGACSGTCSGPCSDGGDCVLSGGVYECVAPACNCDGRECGADSCGNANACGFCDAGDTCVANNVCYPTCTAICTTQRPPHATPTGAYCPMQVMTIEYCYACDVGFVESGDYCVAQTCTCAAGAVCGATNSCGLTGACSGTCSTPGQTCTLGGDGKYSCITPTCTGGTPCSGSYPKCSADAKSIVTCSGVCEVTTTCSGTCSGAAGSAQCTSGTTCNTGNKRCVGMTIEECKVSGMTNYWEAIETRLTSCVPSGTSASCAAGTCNGFCAATPGGTNTITGNAEGYPA